AEMAEILRTEGITVIHETTLFDGKAYNGAYARSLAAVEAILQKYPSIEVVIDVHRDALNQPDAQKYKLISELDGVPCAQLMLVMGTDAAAGDHPLWEENLKLALHMQEALLARSPTLARPIKLTRSSYNQFTAPGAMILEVGANGNSLTEAIRSGQAFAKALAEILLAIG
ncbi:MAG: stage II sporulation protein P, partial [Clostridia bacterium]|nr:stage II sporulation protein P [Clostridia bacterium]